MPPALLEIAPSWSAGGYHDLEKSTWPHMIEDGMATVRVGKSDSAHKKDAMSRSILPAGSLTGYERLAFSGGSLGAPDVVCMRRRRQLCTRDQCLLLSIGPSVRSHHTQIV